MFNLFGKGIKPKTLGQLGEEFAEKEYKRLGYKVVAKNEYNKKGKRLGEIDLIMSHKETIVFVEVKTRTADSEKFGKAVESVNFTKQRKVLAAVKIFLNKNPKYREFRPQIDVCVVTKNEFDNNFKPAIIIKNAVEDWN